MNSIITFLNTTAKSFVGFSISMLIQSSVLIIILLILDFLLRKKFRAVLLYCIWMLILVKLVLPTTLSSPTGLGYWFGDEVPDIITEKASITEQTALILQRIEPVGETIPSGIGIAALPSTGTSPGPTADTSDKFTVTASPASASLSWQGFAFLGWLAVMIAMVLLLIQRMFFVRGLLRQSKNPDDSILDIFKRCRKQMGVHRSVFLKLSPVVASPSVCGLFRPTILIPKNLLGKLKTEDLRSILLHELAHINRGDVWVSLLQTILQIVYFYNPLLWIANVIIRKVREQAVDEMVLVAMGEQAEDYPEILLNISRLTFSRSILSLRLIGVIESKKALHRRIKIMLNRPIPKNAKLGTFGLLIVIIAAAILLPMAKAQKQSVDNAPSVLDLDKDGLENQLEEKLGTNPKSTDTDNDGLSDYDEYCKYRTDPMKKDSDNDGKPDGDWQERREYTYTIRAVCEIRPPSNMEMINDLYQDARPFEKKATLKDARVVEVLIFPFAKAHIYSQPYPKKNLDKKLKEYIKPTVSMNYSPEMKEQIDNIVEGSATDVEAIEKMLQWMNRKTELVRELPHWEYFHIIDDEIAWHKPVGDSQRDERFLETNFLGDSMFKKKVHGTCSSTAILRGTIFRAAGLPTRLVQTLPLITRYSEDSEPLADRLHMREMAKGYTWGPGSGGANHTYNEVFLNNRWVRVDNSIGTGPFVGDKLFVKAWSSADWNNVKEEWNNKRCFRALDVSDAHPKYKTESTKLDIAVEDKNLVVTKQPDGLFKALIRIYNKGSMSVPQFGVHFYAGDPDKGGRLLATHAAGPIMPGGNWGEYNPRLKLRSGDNTITVVVDPGNRVEESDETNNKASVAIQGRQPKKSVKASILHKKTDQAEAKIPTKDREKAPRKVSGIDIKPADFDIRLDEKRGTCNLVVSIRNESGLAIPKFKLKFYRGDLSDNLNEAGKVHRGWHSAGPIEPGKRWNEGTRGFHLPDGQYDFNVFLDYDNSISEIDENNNRALLHVRIENGRIANKSVTCPSSPRDLKTDVQVRLLSDSWRFKGKYSVTLPDDVKVELVGVCDWPKEGRRCWRPDGLKLPVEIYATKWNQNPEVGQYGFMFKVTGPDDLKFSCRITGASSTEGSCKVMDAFGRKFKDLTASISDMEEGRLSTTIRIGVAAGPWETIASHDGKRMTIGRQGGILWSQAFQTDNGTHIVASREWRKDQTDRVVAIDKDGKIHTAGSGSIASGKIDQHTASFRNLKLGEIEEFQYQVRPYQWNEFKNVSLRPGHKTDVQF
jgi:beta-lactamase regulating signal transducer with metallopeptidase domain